MNCKKVFLKSKLFTAKVADVAFLISGDLQRLYGENNCSVDEYCVFLHQIVPKLNHNQMSYQEIQNKTCPV